MADYRVDPEAVVAAAQVISASADSGPSGVLPPADGCGSPPAEALLDDDDALYRLAWKQAVSASIDLTTAATTAASTYRETEAAVESGAH